MTMRFGGSVQCSGRYVVDPLGEKPWAYRPKVRGVRQKVR